MLHELLSTAARRFGDRTALVTDHRRLTFDELHQAAARVAGGLAARGVAPGDRVTIDAPNRWEWIVAYHGVLMAGGVVNPVNTMLTPEEVGFVVSDCGARVLLTTAAKLEAQRASGVDLAGVELVGVFDDAPDAGSDDRPDDAIRFADLLASSEGPPSLPPIDPDSPATIGYTSGTTGHPKGAVQSHRAVRLNCGLTATMHGRTHDEVVVTALPAPHVYGNVVINGTLLAGGTVVLLERFDPAAVLHAIEHERATMFEGVPAMYAMTLSDPSMATADLASLRCCTVGGQTMPVPTMEAWESATGRPLIELWGMTELAGLGTTHAIHCPNRLGSIGVALPGVETRIVDLHDREMACGVDEPGELLVRGPITMLGYYGNPEATAATIDDDGWLRTGDVAAADRDGYLRIVDRRTDVLITGGYNVYPAEIERALALHPAVALSAVGAVPDEVRGELARAYVVVQPGAEVTDQELIDHCRTHLAAYKVPRSVAFVDDLPKTSTGKVMRRALRSLDPPE